MGKFNKSRQNLGLAEATPPKGRELCMKCDMWKEEGEEHMCSAGMEEHLFAKDGTVIRRQGEPGMKVTDLELQPQSWSF